MKKESIIKACVIVGGQTSLARILGVTPPVVYQWINEKRPVPPEQCPSIERATSGAVTCEDLRPDIAWVRIPDRDWLHPQGRPLIDHASKKAA